MLWWSDDITHLVIMPVVSADELKVTSNKIMYGLPDLDAYNARSSKQYLTHCIVNLLKNAKGRPGDEVTSPAYTVSSVTVQPQQSVAVVLRLPRLEAQEMARDEGFLTGSDKFEKAYDCHSWRNVLLQPSENGTIVGGILNSLDEPVHVLAGTHYGDFTLAFNADKPDDSGRVAAVLGPPARPSHLL